MLWALKRTVSMRRFFYHPKQMLKLMEKKIVQFYTEKLTIRTFGIYNYTLLGCVVQLVTCLATHASLTADPGVASSIPARSHTCVEIDHEIISTFILLPSAESFKKGCCKLQVKVCARSTGKLLVQACPGKSLVR